MPAIFIAFFALLTAGGLALGAVSTRQKRERYKALAGAEGWEYQHRQGRLPQHWEAGLLRATPFARGQAVDVFHGSFAGHDFTAFTSAVSNGKSTSYFGVIVLRLRSALPNLGIIRMSAGQRLVRFLGAQDVKTGDANFDESYRVWTDNEEFARVFLGPRMTEWLLRPENYGRPYIIQGGDLLTWHPRALRPEELTAWLAELSQFVDEINPDIWGMFGTPIRELR
jgi:hypothetical protein